MLMRTGWSRDLHQLAGALDPAAQIGSWGGTGAEHDQYGLCQNCGWRQCSLICLQANMLPRKVYRQ